MHTSNPTPQQTAGPAEHDVPPPNIGPSPGSSLLEPSASSRHTAVKSTTPLHTPPASTFDAGPESTRPASPAPRLPNGNDHSAPLSLSPSPPLATKEDYPHARDAAEAELERKRKRRRDKYWARPTVLYDPDSWRSWGMAKIAPPQFVPILLMQAFSAGLLDSTTYADFSTFASNQTGNVVLMTLAAVGTIPVRLIMTGTSLGTFYLASFILGHIGNHVGSTRRAWWLATTTLQLFLITAACVLVSPVGPPLTNIHGKFEWVPMFMLAFMSGAQVTSARQSKVPEIVTAPMTSPMVELVIDIHFFKRWSNKEARSRNLRALYILTIVTGCFIGAIVHRWAHNWVVAVMSIGCKVGTLVLIAFAKGCDE